MQLRPYQQKYIDDTIIDQSNLWISTMRSGKSFILESLIEQKFVNKRVLILVGMRAIILQLADYFDDHTFILAGKQHDDSKHIQLATFQTFTRRDIDFSSYDLVVIDEAHMRYNTPIVKQIRALSCTRLFMTGTPLKPNGRFLDDSIQNIIEHTSMKQMLEDKYLAPTRFISRYNLLVDESEIGTRNGEYIDADIERILDKQAVIQQLVEDSEQLNWSTEHKCILYVNSIKTANKVVKAFADPLNVRVIHSKLSKSELDTASEWYANCTNGIIVNVRMYTIGFDSPSTDTILYLTPTKIKSLFLQSVWRASTINPEKPEKIATCYDYSGTLGKISPYFNKWRKAKPTCKEECSKIKDPIQRYFCEASCNAEPPMTNCTGKMPYSQIDNPYVFNFTVHSGEPCGESIPVFNMTFKSTQPSVGVMRKWSKCKCGCVTYYDIQTMVKPTEFIEVYGEDRPTGNQVSILYSSTWKKALAVLDNPSKQNYSYKMFTDSTMLYEHCLKYFKQQSFSIISNAKSKLPNVEINQELDHMLPLINWETENNDNFMRKLIKLKLEHVIEYFGMKKGYAYYSMKLVTVDNIKQTLNFLNKSDLTKAQLLKYFNKLKD